MRQPVIIESASDLVEIDSILTDATGRAEVITGGRAAAGGGGGGAATGAACSSSHAPAGALPVVGALKAADAPVYALCVGRGAEGKVGFALLVLAPGVIPGTFLKAPMSGVPIGV